MYKKKTRWEEDRDEDNRDRAAVAERVLEWYRKEKDDREEHDEADFRDLLSDMMHWAKREGINFEEELSIAKMNYNAEL